VTATVTGVEAGTAVVGRDTCIACACIGAVSNRVINSNVRIAQIRRIPPPLAESLKSFHGSGEKFLICNLELANFIDFLKRKKRTIGINWFLLRR
jgi:hypothetical protein